MAETVHLFLKANNSDIQGDSTQTSLGRENSIECLEFWHPAKAGTLSTSGRSSGSKRQYGPIVFVKRIDKSSPLLMKAMCSNSVVQGKFLFYRPNPTGDGTTEQFYTIEIKQARIIAVTQYVPDVLNPDLVSYPPMEEVSISFHSVKWTFTNGGVEHEDFA